MPPVRGTQGFWTLGLLHPSRRLSTSPKEGIIFRLRSGCQWSQLPRQFGDDSSVHRTFQRWQERGVFEHIWALLSEACQELGGVVWEWQAADAAMGKARLEGT